MLLLTGKSPLRRRRTSTPSVVLAQRQDTGESPQRLALQATDAEPDASGDLSYLFAPYPEVMLPEGEATEIEEEITRAIEDEAQQAIGEQIEKQISEMISKGVIEEGSRDAAKAVLEKATQDMAEEMTKNAAGDAERIAGEGGSAADYDVAKEVERRFNEPTEVLGPDGEPVMDPETGKPETIDSAQDQFNQEFPNDHPDDHFNPKGDKGGGESGSGSGDKPNSPDEIDKMSKEAIEGDGKTDLGEDARKGNPDPPSADDALDKAEQPPLADGPSVGDEGLDEDDNALGDNGTGEAAEETAKELNDPDKQTSPGEETKGKSLWERFKNLPWGSIVKGLLMIGLAAFAAFEVISAWGALKTGCYSQVTQSSGTSKKVQVTSGKDATCPPSYQCYQCTPKPSTSPPSCTTPSTKDACPNDWAAESDVYQAPCGMKGLPSGKGCCCSSKLQMCPYGDDTSSPSGCHFCIASSADSDGLYGPILASQDQNTCEKGKGIWTTGSYHDCRVSIKDPGSLGCPMENILDNAEQLAKDAWNAGIGIVKDAAGAATWLAHHLALICGSAAGLIVLIIIIIVAVKASGNKNQQQAAPYMAPPQPVSMVDRVTGAVI